MNETKRIYVGEDVLTLSAARDEIRRLLAEEEHPSSIIVHVPEGTYSAEDFVFTSADCSRDCRIEYVGHHSSIHGGITISASDWQLPDPEMLDRFPQECRSKIRRISLADYGLTPADWGELRAIGQYETSAKYDDASTHCGCAVFCDGRRMHIARYPNNSFARLQAIMDVGDCHEFPQQNYFHDWTERRNHRGGSYIIEPNDNEHVKNWKDPSTAWMFGYFFHDWADASTPIASVDPVHRIVNPKYVAYYGAKAGALYYFYNIPEELDAPGEWYLDRIQGNLYFYPFPDSKQLDFSFRNQPLISGTNIQNLTFRGFALQGTMGDAIYLQGDHNLLEDIHIFNIEGNGIVCEGSYNQVLHCEISHTGLGGILLKGGDRNTLTSGCNRASNNYIHDYSEVYLTYQPGIHLDGVGNQCDHNEICNSPHMAIGYNGNEHLIEYNHIHEVVLQSSDAGAIYSGFDWAAHGTVIRYNLLENIGADPFTPDGIYWDDGLSGQTAYGNVLINIRKFAFLIGGGRENHVEGNVIINSGNWPIHYDDRNRDGFVNGGWAKAAVNTPDAPHWQHLKAVPFTSEIWRSKYPTLAKVKTDFSASPDDPDFPINPSYSSVIGNIIIDPRADSINWQQGLADSVFRYSSVSDNQIYATSEDAGWKPETRQFIADSSVFRDIPMFVNPPVNSIGRILKS